MNNLTKCIQILIFPTLKLQKAFTNKILYKVRIISNNTYLISYDYVEPLNKKIITVRI